MSCETTRCPKCDTPNLYNPPRPHPHFYCCGSNPVAYNVVFMLSMEARMEADLVPQRYMSVTLMCTLFPMHLSVVNLVPTCWILACRTLTVRPNTHSSTPNAHSSAPNTHSSAAGQAHPVVKVRLRCAKYRYRGTAPPHY